MPSASLPSQSLAGVRSQRGCAPGTPSQSGNLCPRAFQQNRWKTSVVRPRRPSRSRCAFPRSRRALDSPKLEPAHGRWRRRLRVEDIAVVLRGRRQCVVLVVIQTKVCLENVDRFLVHILLNGRACMRLKQSIETCAGAVPGRRRECSAGVCNILTTNVLMVLQLLELVEPLRLVDKVGVRVGAGVRRGIELARFEHILDSLERDGHEARVVAGQQIAQRLDAALRHQVLDLLFRAARRGVGDGPGGLLLDVELGDLQQMYQRRDDVRLDDCVDLLARPRGDVGNRPARLLPDALLRAAQESQ
mmetsp:Transcript_28986/g.75142  ORF Transcript_28986/g.75142 Transcript_28986/m.75142 type:complete len:303 (+) Transcript_28986:234-1142(+)